MKREEKSEVNRNSEGSMHRNGPSALQQELMALADEKYKAFQSRLIPTVPPERILGVRTPVLRKFAAGFSKRPEAEGFLRELPHRLYEEDNLHAFLLERLGDYGRTVKELDHFLPYVDNWATCDSMRPKILGKHRKELYPVLLQWLRTSETYRVRFAIGMLMEYLKEDFSEEHPRKVLEADDGRYYISMMAAWYLATALAFRFEEILPWFRSPLLLQETRKRALRKALESYRITEGQKEILRRL